jgi:hypothetical protein
VGGVEVSPHTRHNVDDPMLGMAAAFLLTRRAAYEMSSAPP